MIFSAKNTQFLILIFVFTFTIFISYAISADESRLVIERIEMPEYAVSMEPFPVSVAVTDSVGIQRVDVMLDGETFTAPARGKLTEEVIVQVSRRELGLARLEIVAVGVDGVVGESAVNRIVVLSEPLGTDATSMNSKQFVARVAQWEREGRTPFERYARDGLYKKPKLPMQAWDRRYSKYPTQDWIAGAFNKNVAVATIQNWWLRWMELGGGQPFDWKAYLGDSVEITSNGEVLRCWLDLNPLVALSLIWQEVDPVTGEVTTKSYRDWTEEQKITLDWTFYIAWEWLDGRIQGHWGTPPDPPVNMIPPEALITTTGLNSQQAWVLYTATVGHSLALEIGGFIPWSVRDYSLEDLVILFSSTSMFEAGELMYPIQDNGGYTYATFIGYWMNRVTHANPVNTFRFFVENDIIRSTQYYTLARILKWGREKMAHYGTFAGEDPLPMEHMYIFWQYYGAPPVVRIIEGTPRLWDNHVMCWAKGCHGVSDFLVSALRSLNIPAYRLYDVNLLQGHTVPVFPTIGQTMSHGDDIYDVRWCIPTMDPYYLPPEEILLPMTTFHSWFIFQSERHNVGRQVMEIAIEYLPNALMDKYCEDLVSIFPPWEGVVYDLFDHIYSYDELVDMGLWERLEEKNQKFDYFNDYWNP